MLLLQKIFEPSEIVEWVDEDVNGIGITAICPKCGIDSVIGDASNYKIDIECLASMNKTWF